VADLVHVYGQSAGRIWTVLDISGPLSQKRLVEITNLDDDKFYAAVGWLARENKIWNDGTVYKLGETNLIGTIGKDAGKVWRVLDIWNDVDIRSISRLARLDEKEVYAALGWLAREGKLDAKLENNKNTLITYRLK
jgi:hypothetical protein